MKLATLRSQHPDGELVVVSRDLKKMVSAADIAPSLRVAFDDWARNKPKLEERYRQLMSGSAQQRASLRRGALPFAAAALVPVARRHGL